MRQKQIEAAGQVTRLQAFRRTHPEVEILSPRATGLPAWQAIWDTDNGYEQVSRHELRALLDVLEDRFADG